MDKVLIFELREVCYNSYYYFEKQFGDALLSAGYEVQYFRLGRDGTLADIERYIGQSYAAILECNSNLPKLEMDDDSLYLNHLDGPFIDIILDHPLYHHDMLKRKLHNFHVICVDERHAAYIRTHYPHIKSVHVLTMTGEEYKPSAPYYNRSIPLLFTGTYTPLADVCDAISACPSFIRDDIYSLIDMMKADYSLTIEDAVSILAKDSDNLISENFPFHVQAYFLADTYMRSYLRERTVLSLLHAGCPLTLCGADWDRLPSRTCDHVNLLPAVAYEDSFLLMSKAQIVLNVMPLFKAGSHDRIFSAMLNHCACLTDSSSYLDTRFTSGKDIMFFDSMSEESLLTAADKLLTDKSYAASLADAGYENAKAHHSWMQRKEEFLTIMTAIQPNML